MAENIIAPAGQGDPGRPKTMRLAKNIAADYISSLDARFDGEKHYIASCFKSFDKRFPAWLHEGHLIILAARPAMGKSAFAQQIGEHVAAQTKTTLFFTLEMQSYELAERSISQRTGLPVSKLKTAESLTSDDWELIMRGLDEFSNLDLLIDDGSHDINALVNKAKKAAAGLEQSGLPPLGCIVVDYLQMVTAKAANRTLEVGMVTMALKRLAKELAVPVVALSQLNRNLEARQDKRPMLADLRESGQIEQDADLILFLYRDEIYNPGCGDAGIAEIIAAKNRHGEIGTVRMAFVGDRISFKDLAHGQQ